MVVLAMAPFSNGALFRRPSGIRSSSFSTHRQNPQRRQQQQKPPSSHILPVSHYSALLQSCCRETSISNGYIAHDLIVKSGFDQTTYLQNMLLHMYGQCGYMDSASSCFYHIQSPDRYSWNYMVKCFAQQGNIEKIFQFYYQMQCVGMLPDDFAFVSVVSACCSPRNLAEGMHIHAYLVFRLDKLDAIIGTAILTMYGKCGDLRNAQKVFGSIVDLDQVSWNAMLALCDHHDQSPMALDLLEQMLQSNVSPDEFTFTSMVSACTGDVPLTIGRELHDQTIRCSLESRGNVGNCLINLYVNAGCLHDAKKIFDNLISQTIVSWTTMISGYLQHGFSTKALYMLDQMFLEGIFPDQALLVSIFSSLVELQEGKHIHARIIGTEFEMDVKVGNALLSMYVNSGSVKNALNTFNRLSKRELVSWTTMMVGCAEDGQVKPVLQLLEQSRVEGIGQDKVMFISILSACVSALAYLDGKRIHACLMSCGFESDVSVGNALLNMYKRCGHIEDVLTFFARMHSWNNITFISILSACADQAALHDGKLLHSCFVESGAELDDAVENAFLTMYGRSGSLADALTIFDRAHPRNLALWNAMIECYAQNGHGRDTLDFFGQIIYERVIPDAATFVSVLSACAHSGLVDEAYMYLALMSWDYGMTIEVDHYNCMVDLLGRVGRLEDAEIMILSMPCKATSVSWLTLLSACRDHTDVFRAGHAAAEAFALDPKDAAPFVVLSNLYSAVYRQEDSMKVIERLKEIELERCQPFVSNTHSFY